MKSLSSALLFLLSGSLFAQPPGFVNNATQLQRRNIQRPLIVTDLCVLTFVVASSRFECSTAYSGTWGGITGTLSNQTDLVAALALRAPLVSPVFTGQPTIPDFTLAGHTHQNTAGGGTLNAAAIAAGILTGAVGGTGNGFFAIAGPATTLKTHTWPNASINWTALTGAIYMTAGVPSVVAGAGTNFVRVDGTSAAGGGGGAAATLDLTDLQPAKTSTVLLDIAAGTYGVGATSYTVAATSFAPTQYTITSVNTASQIVAVVTPTPPAGAIHNGDSLSASGAVNCAVLNSTALPVIGVSGANITLGVNGSACGSYSGSSATLGTNSSASGTPHVYADSAGAVYIEHPTAAGLIFTCTGPCGIRQVASPGFSTGDETGNLPIATVTLQATGGGTLNTLTDKRRFMSTDAPKAGTGISITPAGGINTFAITSDVARTSAPNNFTGANDFSLATRTAPAKTGTSLPATCAIGDQYFKSDAAAGSNIYGCPTLNTWAVQAGGSAFDPLDQLTQYLVEDFIDGTAGGSNGTLNIGKLGWRAITTGAGTVESTAGVANHWGLKLFTTSGADNDEVNLALHYGSDRIPNLSATTGWEAKGIVETGSAITSVRYQFGLSDTGTIAANQFAISFDTDLGDTNWMCESNSGGTPTRTSTGVAVTTSTYYRLRLFEASSGVLSCQVNATSVVTVSTNIPTADVSPMFAIRTLSAATRAMKVDWFALKMSLTR